MPVWVVSQVGSLPNLARRAAGRFLSFSLLCYQSGLDSMCKQASLGVPDHNVPRSETVRDVMNRLSAPDHLGKGIGDMEFRLKLILQELEIDRSQLRLSEAAAQGRGITSH